MGVDGSTVTAVLAEDQPLLRDAIASLLELRSVRVLARCGTSEELLRAVRELRPAVAIVDIRMPPTFTDEGLRAARHIRERHAETGVLVLAQHVEPEHAAALVDDDASGLGYLLKERVADGESFVDAVHRVASGGTAFDPQVVAVLVAGKRRGALEILDERQLQVLSLMAEGLSNAAISSRLHLGSRAVEREISAVFSRLSLPDTHEHNRRVLAVLAYLGISGPST